LRSRARAALPRLAIALAAALALPAEPTRAELPGDPDPSFNRGQPVLLDLARGTPRRTWLNGAAVDAQGGIVVTGYASDENGKSPSPSCSPDSGRRHAGHGLRHRHPAAARRRGTRHVVVRIRRRPAAGRRVAGSWARRAPTTRMHLPEQRLVVAFDAWAVDVGFRHRGPTRAASASTTQDCFVGRGAIAADGATYVSRHRRSRRSIRALSKVTAGDSPT
jgi:hypothetical protein